MGMRPTLFAIVEYDEDLEEVLEKFKVKEDYSIDLLYSSWSSNYTNDLDISRNALICYVFNGWGEEHDPKDLEPVLKDAKFLAEFLTNPKIYLTMGMF